MNSFDNKYYSQTPQWISTIFDTYGLSVYSISVNENGCKGSLDIVHMKHSLFGNSLVSIPFSDVGGFNTSYKHIEKKLFHEALRQVEKCKADTLEIRMDHPVEWLNEDYLNKTEKPYRLVVNSHKVGMTLELPGTTEELMAGFKSKLRSQIKKPIKDGMSYLIGGSELIDDFYNVFSINMRDLGSPVHSRELFYNFFNEFHNNASVIVVYAKNKKPVASAIFVGTGTCMSNPWASSLRDYRTSSPNMLLYWAMLEYAVKKKFRQFDFGRSTPGEGTHAFKVQWGAKPKTLYWYTISLKPNMGLMNDRAGDNNSLGIIVRMWQKLPVSIATLMGPWIRKNISL